MGKKTFFQHNTATIKAVDGTRTRDLLITNQLLYHLSHNGMLNLYLAFLDMAQVNFRDRKPEACYETALTGG